MNIAFNYFSGAKGAVETVANIAAAGGKANAPQRDLNKNSDVDTPVSKTATDFGRVEVLVNNTAMSVMPLSRAVSRL